MSNSKILVRIGGKAIMAPQELLQTEGCVYKLHYGKGFVVVMGKSFARSIETIHGDLARYQKNTERRPNAENLYYPLYQFVQSNPDEEFYVEVLARSNNGYQLLKACQQALWVTGGDSTCLNAKKEPYISKEIHKPIAKQERRWWISRGSYLNFRKWQRKNIPVK